MSYRDGDGEEFGLIWSEETGWYYLIPGHLDGDAAVPMEAHFLLAVLQRMCKEPEFIKDMVVWLDRELNPRKLN